MNSDRHAPTRIVGSAAIFLRPLRYMFDVETDVVVVDEEESAVALPFETVHVHLRVATQPPLMERDELLNGFLRAETPIHSSAVTKHSSPCGPNSKPADSNKFGVPDSKLGPGEDEPEDSERTLTALRGTYVWLLVRLQPLSRSKAFFSILPEEDNTKEALLVQYQISPPSESFCLPVDHTNVVKLLVTDDLIDQVDAKMLHFKFLSVPLRVPDRSPSKDIKMEPDAPVRTCINYTDTALEASEAAVAEEARRRKLAEAELVEAKSTAQAKDRERLEAQLQAKQDAQRAQELELARNEQAHARSLLELELAAREQQNQELKQTRKHLEDQLQATNENARRFQINITSTDQALEASLA
ncbi:unnamed protein product [Phytophthora fragariaefolia]|uniref:Unnamed protein product n=1 Tax=Phytophthora fragariaefolia TaxID=1490495 RepID=A0A9W6XSH6_9STRA|nr:unnamed protein product [Phytophthora fragariaefolia]